MTQNTKVSTRMARNTVRVNSSGLIKALIKVTLLQTKFTVKVFTYGLTAAVMTESGLIAKCRDKVFSSGQMDANTLAPMTTTRKLALD